MTQRTTLVMREVPCVLHLPDTLSRCISSPFITAAGSAITVVAESKKQAEYLELSNAGDDAIAPIAIQTLEASDPFALDITAEIGGKIEKCMGDIRSRTFLRQKLDVAIQTGNAAAVHRTNGRRIEGLPYKGL